MINTSAAPRSPRALADLCVVLCLAPGRTFAESAVMLARVRPVGTFELLTAAWANALGYTAEELSGTSLCELITEKSAASEFVAALLEVEDGPPLHVTLRCKDQRTKSFRLHRRFDPYDKATFVLADELGEERVATLEERKDALEERAKALACA